MIRLGIVGGKLQGVEATYLAKKAGYQTVVFDRNPSAPALSLADEAVVMDVTAEGKKAAALLADCDAVLPANEDLDTLVFLADTFRSMEVPLIFDLNAYQLSSSKVRSNEFMRQLNLPLPRPWPECGFPVVVKPSGESGSAGVTRATNADELIAGKEKVRQMGGEVVVQEFVDGPSISVEVIGNGSDAVPLVTTQIFLDDNYDCKMVGSPWEAPDKNAEDLISEAGYRIAMELGLRGIMDVEAIVCKGIPRVLEIDARIPSQTPIAVLHSHDINMVKMLVDMSVNDRLDSPRRDGKRTAFYEHVAVDDGVIRSCGEGVFAEVRRPTIVPGLFGADEVISDYEPGKRSWRATIITTGRTAKAARLKREKVMNNIITAEGLTKYLDPRPEGYA